MYGECEPFPEDSIQPHCCKPRQRPSSGLYSKDVPPLTQENLIADSHIVICRVGEVEQNETGYIA